MQKRRLGRTNLMSSIIGFGGIPISHLNKKQAHLVIKRAFDLGINYFDTGADRLWYGDSQEKIGVALEDVRDQCILATKTPGKKGVSHTQFRRYLRRSLRDLKTDRIDLIQLHGIDHVKRLKREMERGGSLDACKKARSEGKVDYIGITGHRPHVLDEAIKTNEFDAVLVPLNFFTRQASEDLIPIAKEYDVGVAIMKAFVVKISTIPVTTVGRRPSLPKFSFFSDEFKLILGKDKATVVRNALNFVLAHDICTVVVGMKSIAEVEMAAHVGNSFKGLTEKEKGYFRLGIPLDKNSCRDCGVCLPCPISLNIPAILRLYSIAVNFGLKNWAKKRYQELSPKAESCTECGLCEIKCPYAVPIMDQLRLAEKEFQDVQEIAFPDLAKG